MKKLISIITIMCFSSLSVGSCEWKNIKDNGNKTYTYGLDCHLEVGKLVQDSKIKDQQIADYLKAISLKDEALKAADKRATLWNNTASDLEGRLQKIDSLERFNAILYFGGGILAAVLIGIGLAQVAPRR